MRYALEITLASTLAALGIIFPIAWPLSFLGLGWFLHLIVHRTHCVRRALVGGLLFGTIAAGAALIWAWDSLPIFLDSPVGVAEQARFLFCAWLLSSLAAGVPVALFALVVWQFRTSRFLVLWGPLAWVVCEEARLWAYALLMWGSHSTLGPHMSTLSFGYPLADSFFLPLARFGGLAALTGAASVLAFLTAFYIGRHEKDGKERVRLAGAGALALCLCFVALLAVRPQATVGSTQVVAIVTTNDPQGQPADPVRVLRSLADAPTPFTIALTPEDTGIEFAFPDESARRTYYRTLFGDREVLIVSSSYDAQRPGNDNASLIFESTAEGVLARYQKMVLAPFGEYLPLLQELLLKGSGSKDAQLYASSFDASFVRPGLHPVALEYRGLTFGALVCSDILSHALGRELKERYDTEVFVALANTSWFHGSRNYFAKQLQAAKVHAVANNVYFLESANGSPSFALAPSGAVLAMSRWGEEGILYVEIPVGEE